mmetsp:Transcript_17308/g.47953  ORF Transcript_17308/g.47953 Transcript_17308/m.47953 type:complete len:273 (-) Transcript_17308:74-892(-)
MGFGNERKVVGADLVCCVTIGAHTVGANNAGVDRLGLHQCAGCGIANETTTWHLFFHDFERCQSGSLVVRTRFQCCDAFELVHALQTAHNTQSRTVASCRQRSRVANGDDVDLALCSTGLGEDGIGTELANGLVVLNVAIEHEFGVRQDGFAQLLTIRCALRGSHCQGIVHRLLCLRQGIGEIDGRGTRCVEVFHLLLDEGVHGSIFHTVEFFDHFWVGVEIHRQSQQCNDGDQRGACDDHDAEMQIGGQYCCRRRRCSRGYWQTRTDWVRK